MTKREERRARRFASHPCDFPKKAKHGFGGSYRVGQKVGAFIVGSHGEFLRRNDGAKVVKSKVRDF